MHFLNILFIVSLIWIQEKSSTIAYKIDFQNGENKIHLESTAVENGKIINEPKVEEAIKTLSGFKFNNNMNKDANKNANKFENTNENDDHVESNENSRIFITNINKNINTNDEGGSADGSTSGSGSISSSGGEEKTIMSGFGNAHVVPMSSISSSGSNGKKTGAYLKPLKATRVVQRVPSTYLEGRDEHENTAAVAESEWIDDQAEEAVKAEVTAEVAPPRANLRQIVPELVENPLWFVDENVTTTV